MLDESAMAIKDGVDRNLERWFTNQGLGGASEYSFCDEIRGEQPSVAKFPLTM